MPIRVVTDPMVVSDQGGATWRIVHNGLEGAVNAPLRIHSKFGSFDHVIVTDDKGAELYNRVRLVQRAHVSVLPWFTETLPCGLTVIKVVLVKEVRPMAHDFATNEPRDTALVFWGVAGGFLESKETPEQAAKREGGEEAGAVLLPGKLPLKIADLNPDPSVLSTAASVISLHVDGSKVQGASPDPKENIMGARAFELYDLYRRIAQGWFDGASFADGCAMAVLSYFQAAYLDMVVPYLAKMQQREGA